MKLAIKLFAAESHRFSMVRLGFAAFILLAPPFVNAKEASVSDHEGPVETARRVIQGVADGEPRVVWDALPPSTRWELTDLVRTFAYTMDAEIWNRSLHVFRKGLVVWTEQRNFILKNFALTRPEMPQSPKSLSDSIKGDAELTNFWAGVLYSELSDLERLKELDIGQFLETPTPKTLLRQVIGSAFAYNNHTSRSRQLTNLESERAFLENRKKMAEATVTLLSENKKTTAAKVRVKIDGSSHDVDLVLLEGKWVLKGSTANFADFSAQIATAKANWKLISIRFRDPKIRTSILGFINGIDAILDKLLAAKTQADFDISVIEAKAEFKNLTEEISPKE